MNNWNLCLKGFDVDERKGNCWQAWREVECQPGRTSHVKLFWLTSLHQPGLDLRSTSTNNDRAPGLGSRGQPRPLTAANFILDLLELFLIFLCCFSPCCWLTFFLIFPLDFYLHFFVCAHTKTWNFLKKWKVIRLRGEIGPHMSGSSAEAPEKSFLFWPRWTWKWNFKHQTQFTAVIQTVTCHRVVMGNMGTSVTPVNQSNV